MQLDFFGADVRRFVDDGISEIAYYPQLIDPQRSAALFGRLQAELPWSNDRMWMYDHEVDVPRLRVHYHQRDEAPADLLEVCGEAERLLDATFNSISLNYYRNERDSVAWHNDHLDELVDRPVIAVLSLGAVRAMLVRSKGISRRQFSCDLAPGSLLVMRGRSQEFWEHHIPKVKVPVGARISIAFRQRRQQRNLNAGER